MDLLFGKQYFEFIPLLENVPTLPNPPSPMIFMNSKWRSLLAHSTFANRCILVGGFFMDDDSSLTLFNPFCKVNYSMLISSRYNYRLFGIK